MSKPVTDNRLPGDPLAALPLKNAAGENVNLWDQSLAGRAVLLWFSGASPSAAAREALSRDLSELESLETLLYEVGPQPTETPLKLAIDGGEAARMLGVAPPGFAVLDSARRLTAVLPEGALEQALALCRDQFARSASDPVGAQAPVLLVPGLFEPELCRRLIEHWNVSEKRADTVSSVTHGDSYASAAFKKRRDVWIADPALLQTLQQRIGRRAVPEIRKAFNFRVVHGEVMRIGCYDSADGGYFRAHRDNTTPYTAHRQFAMSVNLNTGEYEGGDVRFPEYGHQLYRPGAGGAVIFSCSLLHEALPVTKGRRFGLFTFLYDEEGRRAEQRMRQERGLEGAAR
jgi:predicted 2-oxoglutarate/Fe(II)-dependent dioxygenase YbiX